MPISSSRGNLFVAFSLLSLTLLGAGCGGTRPLIDTDTNTLNLQGEGGSSISAGESAQIPANFPSYIPRIANGKTTLAYSENNGKTNSIIQQTTGSFVEARTFVEQTFQSEGFTKENTLESPDLVIFSFTKGATRCQVNVAHQAPTTQVQTTCVEQ